MQEENISELNDYLINKFNKQINDSKVISPKNPLTESQRDKVKEGNEKPYSSNLSNSDSFQIFNYYQEDNNNNNNGNNSNHINNNNNSSNKPNSENFSPRQVKNTSKAEQNDKEFYSNVDFPNKNINNNKNNNNTIEEEELDLEKFYEEQQHEMEKALKTKNNNFNTSKTKFKDHLNSYSYNKKPENKSISGLFKTSIIKSNNTSIMNHSKIDKPKNLKNTDDTNHSINAKSGFSPVNDNNNKNANANMQKNFNFLKKEKESEIKHKRNNSALQNNNQNGLRNINYINSRGSPSNNQNKNESNNKANLNRSYSKKAATSNHTIITNKISYDEYKSSFSGNFNKAGDSKPLGNYTKPIKKSDSTTNLKTSNSNNKNSNLNSKNPPPQSTSKEKTSQINPKSGNNSPYKNLTANKNDIHNIIKLKITNNDVEEIPSINLSHNNNNNKNTSSKVKNKYLNYKEIFEKKREYANIKNTIMNNANSYKNFLTIQDHDSCNNNFRKSKNLGNVKIDIDHSNNISSISNNNVLTSKGLNVPKALFVTGINSVKGENGPIKLNGNLTCKSNKNEGSRAIKSEANIFDVNSKKDNFFNNLSKGENTIVNKSKNKESERYLKAEQEKNSYSYILKNNKNKILIEKNAANINNNHHSGDKEKENVLLAKILKENNISIYNTLDVDENDKRCLTQNEKLNEFLTLNLNYESILNNIREKTKIDNPPTITNVNDDNNKFKETQLSYMANKNKASLGENNQNPLKENSMSHFILNLDNNRNNHINNYTDDKEINLEEQRNFNSQQEEPEKERQKGDPNKISSNNFNSIDNSMLKDKIEHLTNKSRSNQLQSSLLLRSQNNIKSSNAFHNFNNNNNNTIEDTKQSNTDKTLQYHEIYSKRKETLEKINKSTQEKDKDFYEKNMEWKKKINEEAKIKKEEIDKENLKECHFTPKGVKRAVSKESLDNFYEKNLIWKQNIEKYKQMQNLIKERKEYEECFFQPTTNKKIYESNIGSNKDQKKNDYFYNKNIEWLNKTKENKKTAELLYHEEITGTNKEKITIRGENILSQENFEENNFINNSARNNYSYNINFENETPKSMKKDSNRNNRVYRGLSATKDKRIFNRSHSCNKKAMKTKNSKANEYTVTEDPDIKLEKDLREMENLMESLISILQENQNIMSIPDNQEEFFVYNNINNQSFANQDNYNMPFTNHVNFKNLDPRKTKFNRISSLKKDNCDNFKCIDDIYNEKYNILREKMKRAKLIKIEENKI